MKNNIAIYLQDKRSKRGVALSMAMAIGFMLVIIVCMLVSIATLNITTTQDTVSERDAYVQAKSALNFAESYYFADTNRLPGGGISSSSDVKYDLVSFTKGNAISDGASVEEVTSYYGTTTLEDMYDDALTDSSGAHTYVLAEYKGSSGALVLTAVAKLDGSDSSYTLSKEYGVTEGGSSQSSSFTGNITYDINSSTKYLRIHVRPSSDAIYNPYLYTWAEEVNTSTDSDAYGTSGIVNHLTMSYNNDGTDSNTIDEKDQTYALSGEWISTGSAYEQGPQGVMDYEGNGWYLYTIEIPDSYSINTVSAIVSAKGSLRSSGYQSQTWEIFGIPVPTETGEANGVDVYITLNNAELHDAQHNNVDDSVKSTIKVTLTGQDYAYTDDLSRWYNACGSYTTFAQFTSQYYTVYTKKDIETIIYYRKAYDTTAYSTSTGDVSSPSNPGSSGTYVGYGWYRDVSTDSTVTLTLGGSTYTINSDYCVSQNEYGKEQIREAYVVTNGTDWACFKTEEEANEQLIAWGDNKAADYVTVYAQGDDQPVDSEVTTTLDYESTYIDSDIDIEPDATWIDNPNNNSYVATADTATATSYYIGGNMYESSEDMTEMFSSSEGYTYTFTNMMPGTYTYNIYNGDGTVSGSSLLTTGSITIEYVCSATITYNSSSNTISLTTDPDSGTAVDWVYVGFHNGVVTDISGTNVTSFTSAWSEVYVNYTIGTSTGCIKLDSSYVTADGDGNNVIWWVRIPDNTDSFYFSNMSTSGKSDSDYQCTTEITSFSANAFYYPKTSSGGTWSVGTKTDYRKIKVSSTSVSNSVTMVYADTNQVVYYDIPIVDLLDALSGGTGRVYASRCWTNYEIKLNSGYNYGGTKFTFNSSQRVTYQGETYYWVDASSVTSTSILILNNSVSPYVATAYDAYGNSYTDNNGSYGGAVYLYAGDFAVKELQNTASGSEYLLQYSNLRDGATYTSSGTYYDGSSSPISYGDYVPSWYMYKIPASDTYTIKSITGVDGSNTSSKKNTSGQEFEVIDAGQSVYITYDSGTFSMYTFDTSTYQVDTNASNEDTIYFDNGDGWSDVYVYAVGINGTTEQSLSRDSTVNTSAGDTAYYNFTFTSGEYCFFTFYEPASSSDTSYANATDKTVTYYFTGAENDDREFQILAKYGSDTLQYYLHPRTKALYAYQDLLGAYNASFIYMEYTYSGGTYTANDSGSRLGAASGWSDAQSYYNSGDSGWSSSRAGDYADLAEAATNLVSAIKKARVYLDGYEDSSGTTHYYPEGQNKDDLVTYTKASLYSLWNAYSAAISLYSNSSASVDDINSVTNNLLNTIASMNYTISSEAVQIIVSDVESKWGTATLWGATVDSSTGTVTWTNTGMTLLDTTQSNYYAYLFKKSSVDSYSYFTITNGSSPTYSTQDELNTAYSDKHVIMAVNEGDRYNFYTKDSQFETDTSLPTYTLDATEVKEGEVSEVYAEIVTPRSGMGFVLYVEADCYVEYGSECYWIFAGAYTIKSSYTLADGSIGIDLCSDTAKDFFATDNYFSMTDDYGSGVSQSNYDSIYDDNEHNVGSVTDVLIRSGIPCNISFVTASGTATSGSCINYRYKNSSSSAELDLNNTVSLKAETVTVAINNLEIQSSGSFKITASKVIFYTNVEVTCSDGTTYTIEQGTYTGGTSSEIDLNNPDWSDDWQKLTEHQEIGSGTYVKN